MPLHDDEMNMRREKREAQRRKQQAEAKRLRITLILAAVVLVLCTAGIVFLTSRSDSSQTTVAAEPRPTQKPTQATEPATRAQKSTKTTIHIKAAGDLNVTNTVINAGVAVGGYNYTRAFMDVASALSDADSTVLNLEGNICGEPYGSDTTSAPRELLDGLRNAGVDLIPDGQFLHHQQRPDWPDFHPANHPGRRKTPRCWSYFRFSDRP
ncbi:MAG: CapA family protein [Oscillospiraceae bacterium]